MAKHFEKLSMAPHSIELPGKLREYVNIDATKCETEELRAYALKFLLSVGALCKITPR